MNTLFGEVEEKTKCCAKCKRDLPLSAFAKANGNYPRSECRECGKKQHKIREELKKVNPKPGADYNCPICERSYEDVKYLGNRINGWCMDHDHTTHKFRGYLCHDCNKALGFFKDNIDLLKSAVKYLENA